MYAITGITGNVGGASARALLNAGKKVRGVVRDKSKAAHWQKAGVELVIADLDDANALSEAFRGSEGRTCVAMSVRTCGTTLPESRSRRESRATSRSMRQPCRETESVDEYSLISRTATRRNGSCRQARPAADKKHCDDAPVFLHE